LRARVKSLDGGSTTMALAGDTLRVGGTVTSVLRSIRDATAISRCVALDLSAARVALSRRSRN
jgi:hypothetical protein